MNSLDTGVGGVFKESVWLKIIGVNKYIHKDFPNPASTESAIRIQAPDIEGALQLWQFIYLYMEGSDSLDMDLSEVVIAARDNNNIEESMGKQLLSILTGLYTTPRDFFDDFCCNSDTRKTTSCILFLLFSPVAIISLIILSSWAFTATLLFSKRKPAFFPEDFINKCDDE